MRSFAVCLFILVVQFLSRYKSDLFGKGLEAWVLFKIFAYASISLVVLALPVSVLLSSLFTMGNFGENYELAAMRSAGLSIPRVLRPMVLVTVLIASFSFGLYSYVVPWANLKLYSLLWDVQQMKPVFSLEPGHFNSGVDNYVIRIVDKDVSREMLFDVMIYDHTMGTGNNRVLLADSGTMKVDPYGRFMKMMLYHGVSYENRIELDKKGQSKDVFIRFYYDSLYYSFDLAGFDFKRTEEQAFKSHQFMLNLTELGAAMDSIERIKQNITDMLSKRLMTETHIDSGFMTLPYEASEEEKENILARYPRYGHARIYQNALDKVRAARRLTAQAVNIINEQTLKQREREIELHGKISLPLACMVFLFIGAPLGAIIRRGGAGIPIVVSVTLYLAFYVIMIQGKKMAVEGVMEVWTGVWLPVLVMLPLALFLSFESISPVRVFTADNLWRYGRAVVRFLIIINPVFWLFQIPFVRKVFGFVFGPVIRVFRKKEEKPTFRVRR